MLFKTKATGGQIIFISISKSTSHLSDETTRRSTNETFSRKSLFQKSYTVFLCFCSSLFSQEKVRNVNGNCYLPIICPNRDASKNTFFKFASSKEFLKRMHSFYRSRTNAFTQKKTFQKSLMSFIYQAFRCKKQLLSTTCATSRLLYDPQQIFSNGK